MNRRKEAIIKEAEAFQDTALSHANEASRDRSSGKFWLALGIITGVGSGYHIVEQLLEREKKEVLSIEIPVSTVATGVLIASGAKSFSHASHQSRMSAVYTSAQLDLENALIFDLPAATPQPSQLPVTTENSAD